MRMRITGHLLLANIEVIHVDKRNYVSILIVIEDDPNFVKQELHIEPRSVFIQIIVHNYLRQY